MAIDNSFPPLFEEPEDSTQVTSEDEPPYINYVVKDLLKERTGNCGEIGLVHLMKRV